jgi:HIP---CoA ligase
VTTIPQVLAAAVERAPDRLALVTSEVRWTFAELASEVRRTARALVAVDVGRGDRVGVWAPNSHRWATTALGTVSLGAVLVPVNTRFKGEEARYCLERASVSLVVVDDDFLAGLLGTDPVEALGLDVPVVRMSAWEAFLAGATDADVDALAAAVTDDDPCDIVFTSGTTGRPKGVVARHGASVRLFATWADTVGLRDGERMLVVAPFFHTFGYKAGLLACLLKTATCLPLAVFDVDEAVRVIDAEQVAVVPGPPTLFSSLLDHPKGGALPSLRLAVTGAAVVPQVLVERMRTDLGFESVITAYGLTECGGFATGCRVGDPDELVATTSGRAVDGVEVRVVGDDGTDVPTGEPGEVWIRSYAVMSGYWDDDAATAEAITPDGWLRTGDVGVLDAGGNLRITDRIKDMYVVGGFNAYPAEVEQVLLRHEGVADVAVVGVPDERMGEVGKAFVVPRGSLDPDALLAWSKERLANYKVPRTVELVDALPRNASGKVLKHELRAR